MPNFVDEKFVNLISNRLPKFQRKKRGLWNFRCVICGDSKRNKNKCRGFLVSYKDTIFYKCHNCGYSTNFSNFLKEFDPTIYKEYQFEKFKESNSSSTTNVKIDENKIRSVVSGNPNFSGHVLDGLVSLQNLNSSHPAKEYILNRKLPLNALYFTEKFKEWANSVKPGSFQNIVKDEPRIVIPFFSREGEIFAFQGRALNSSSIRYVTIKLNTHPLIYGLNHVHYDQPIFITEGPFDSLLLDNAIAMSGASLSDINWPDHSRCIYVYDNEPRNRDITRRMSDLIAEGEEVVIWPSFVKQKDINEMIMAGMTSQEVMKIISENSYSGLLATHQFTQWKNRRSIQ